LENLGWTDQRSRRRVLSHPHDGRHRLAYPDLRA
jgi:hypothetical protein